MTMAVTFAISIFNCKCDHPEHGDTKSIKMPARDKKGAMTKLFQAGWRWTRNGTTLTCPDCVRELYPGQIA